MSELCPCGNEKSFNECCGRHIAQGLPAITPEALMRSRYTAFVFKDMKYVFRTTHPKARATLDQKAQQEWADRSEFFKLEILKSSHVGDTGSVEFKAHYRNAVGSHVHHELSSFRRKDGLWYFLNGKVIEEG